MTSRFWFSMIYHAEYDTEDQSKVHKDITITHTTHRLQWAQWLLAHMRTPTTSRTKVKLSYPFLARASWGRALPPPCCPAPLGRSVYINNMRKRWEKIRLQEEKDWQNATRSVIFKQLQLPKNADQNISKSQHKMEKCNLVPQDPRWRTQCHSKGRRRILASWE